ncbi:MAG: two-component regulator propeller domain-containing protein [Lutibacter sp.]
MTKISKKITSVFFYLMLFQIFFENIGTNVFAQSYNKISTFSTNEGLPSNHIYDIAEDGNGFLWIATNNGLARFDGKYFYNYSTKNGLPSNDVLQVIKEKDGTIWANCYNETPSYFDEINNQFVTINKNENVNKISSALLNYLVLPNEGIRFYNAIGSFDFIDKKIQKIKFFNSLGYLFIDSKEVSFHSKQINLKTRLTEYKNYFSYKGKAIDSFSEKSNSKIISRIFHSNNYYSFFTGNIVHRYSNFKRNPFSFTIDSIAVPESYKWYKFSANDLSIIANSGAIYIYDLRTLKLQTKIENSTQTNCAFIDSHQNLWLGTLDNGLLYYNLTNIKRILTSSDFANSNFLSVAVTAKGEILAGNYHGQILKSKGIMEDKFTIPFENKSLWIRKLIYVNNNILSINDAGYSINFKKNKPITSFLENNSTCSLKTAIKLNDSIAIVGTTRRLYKLNIQNEKYKPLNSPDKRILNIVKQHNDTIYFVGAEGLYKYNYKKNTYTQILLNNKEITGNKPSVLAYSKNNFLWVATIKGDILILKNDTVLYKIKGEEGLPENITNMIAVQNKIWIASKSGVYIIDFKEENKKLDYTINKLSKSDGLTSNVVNELAFYNDSIYAATDNGISIIPSKIKFSKFEIFPNIISITVNSEKVAIAKSYHLENDEKNISIQLSGVELSGHFKNLQYSLNDKNNWVDLDGNTINLSLKGGNNNLFIRAIDVNNNISDRTIELQFFIAIPFFKKLWFWILLISLLMALAFWWFNHRKFNQQKIAFQQQLALEQQRNKITADLHDDIGATLSSLQINSAVANQLLNKNPIEAKKVLQKIETQSQNLADKIGDIIWSMKPGKDEFMTLSTRIRNFVSDILGSTDIKYIIETDPVLDHLIKDITLRKNIILIIKEGVNNVAKYSKASQLNIKLGLINNTITIEIIDNGIGFEINETFGNGIANMRKRVEELKGDFKITSSPQQGTSIFANIPFVP